MQAGTPKAVQRRLDSRKFDIVNKNQYGIKINCQKQVKEAEVGHANVKRSRATRFAIRLLRE